MEKAKSYTTVWIRNLMKLLSMIFNQPPETERLATQPGVVCPESYRLLAGESPALVTVRQPGSRHPVQPGDWLC
jgi:hypothetical protein